MVGVLLASSLVAAACAGPGPTPASSGASGNSGSAHARVVQVVAAENFWGSIASQLGGTHAHVVSLITNPNTDPHSYEPTAADARLLAGAQMVVENGIGYDPWVDRLLSADGGGIVTLDVGTLLGLADGSNPHRWYDPDDVREVIGQMTSDLQAARSERRGVLRRRGAGTSRPSPWRPTTPPSPPSRPSTRGTPVGASESIFAMLAPSLGLDLITPPSFLKAVSEGTDVSVADKETIDTQIRDHEIKLYVYNSQNVTPDVQAQLQEVKAEHIPYATITETLQPADATYQAWQTRQLLGIEAALARGRG